MAARASAQAGYWGDPATWGGTVPVDGDSVTITHEVLAVNADNTAGIDQSGFATGIAGIVITSPGILEFSTAAGWTTYLKMASGTNISGTGALYIGNRSITDASPDNIPKNSNVTIHWLATTGTISVTTVRMFGWFDNVNWRNHSNLSAGYSAGATEVVINDQMGLENGDQVVIGRATQANLNTADTSCLGVYTISAYDSGTRTLTINALESSRQTGDIVAWLKRPSITLRRTSAGGVIITSANAILEGVQTIYGGLTSGNTSQITHCTSQQYTSNTMAYTGAGGVVRGLTWHRSASQGCGGAFTRFYDCVCVNTNRGWVPGTGCVMYDCHTWNVINNMGYNLAGNDSTYYDCTNISINSQDYGAYNGCNKSMFYNCKFSCPTPFMNYTQVAYSSPCDALESFDHNQVQGAYRCACLGGQGLNQSTTPYNGEDTLKLMCETASYWVFRDFWIFARAGRPLNIAIPCMKDFSGANVAGIWIIEAEHDPRVTDETICPPAAVDYKSDDTNTWEVLTASVTPTYDRLYKVVVWAKAASGNVYFYTKPLERMLPARTVRPIIQL